MIVEKQLTFLNNIIPKINKKSPPRSVNPDLTPFFFTSMFIGAKNSGKTYGLVKMIRNYESHPIKDHDGNVLPVRTILFCPTGNSEANPIYKTLKSLDDKDIVLEYSDDAFMEKLNEIEKDKQDIEKYEKYCKAYKMFIKHNNMAKIDPEDILLLHENNFAHPDEIPKPKYEHPPIIFMILDDLIGSNDCFKRGNCLMSNITIKHRHLGLNLVFTSQNPKSIPNIIRNNIDVFVLYKFANVKMVLEKIQEEVSNLVTEDQFEELYRHATNEPHNALVIDTHPQSDRDKRFRKNFDKVLVLS